MFQCQAKTKKEWECHLTTLAVKHPWGTLRRCQGSYFNVTGVMCINKSLVRRVAGCDSHGEILRMRKFFFLEMSGPSGFECL